jgi:hypothetical protein
MDSKKQVISGERSNRNNRQCNKQQYFCYFRLLNFVKGMDYIYGEIYYR